MAFLLTPIFLWVSCAPEMFLTKSDRQASPEEIASKGPGPPVPDSTAAKEEGNRSPRADEPEQLITPPKPERAEKIVVPVKPDRTTRTPSHIAAEKAQEVAPPEERQKTLEPPVTARPTGEVMEGEPPAKPREAKPPSPPPKAKKKSNQELLDSAMEFCQASYDFWEQGDLENAIESLDQAYSLILRVDPEENSEILQQREDLRITISKRILEVYSSRYTVANGFYKAIPLVMNRHVRNAIKLLKGKERKFFLNAYRRSGRYRPAIVRALKEAGLPEELSWLPLIESGFKVRALSRARALGLWQFIASTGYKYGLKRDRWIDERMDPEKSTAAAIAYLKELHQIFGDWETVLAAYNCGEGKVLKVIRAQRINYLDHFWDLYERLPSETAFYVPKFLAVLHILTDPEAYGFTLPPPDEEVQTDEVTVNKQVHLKAVARELGISYGLLKELNPALRRNSTPGTPYALKVPKGKGQEVLARLEHIPLWQPPIPAYVIHRVRRGESLSVIARRYRTSVRAIMNLNGLRREHYIKIGWKLRIPIGRTYASIQKTSPPLAISKMPEKPERYVVRRGDSLWKIASAFGTTVRAIQSLNQLKTARLSTGQTLRLPPPPTPSKEMKTKQYTILKGDSPYLIAKKHHMNLSELLRLNNLTPRSTIFPGEVLLVKAE